MIQAIRARATVKPGGSIEIRNPALPEGASAEVIVMIESPAPALPPLASYVGATKGVYGTAEQIDRHLREMQSRNDPGCAPPKCRSRLAGRGAWKPSKASGDTLRAWISVAELFSQCERPCGQPTSRFSAPTIAGRKKI